MRRSPRLQDCAGLRWQCLGGAPAGFACVSGVFYYYCTIMYYVKVGSFLDLDGALPQALGSGTGMVCRLDGKVPQALVGMTSTRR